MHTHVRSDAKNTIRPQTFLGGAIPARTQPTPTGLSGADWRQCDARQPPHLGGCVGWVCLLYDMRDVDCVAAAQLMLMPTIKFFATHWRRCCRIDVPCAQLFIFRLLDSSHQPRLRPQNRISEKQTNTSKYNTTYILLSVVWIRGKEKPMLVIIMVWLVLSLAKYHLHKTTPHGTFCCAKSAADIQS